MSRRKPSDTIRNLYKQICQPFSLMSKSLIKWFLRSLLIISRKARKQSRLAKAGFVLPTVAMVSVVIVLLTTALVFRSFDRSGIASNTRVNQAVLNAAMPAIERAKAKLDALFKDQTNLPRSTPSDLALYNALNKETYKLGDENRLKLVNDFNKDNIIQKPPVTNIENDETLTTAWKFPVDTDNDGMFDSYTLYGIYFRSPSRGTDGKFNRSRNPLEARTPPMSGGNINAQCFSALGTSGSLVGDSSWYKSGSKLKKSFFVYTTTVPITNVTGLDDKKYQTYKGNKGFSALELQQDRSRISLTNNAVVFQDDLELTPGSTVRLNGRVFTNANLLIGGRSNATVRLYQVSSKNSCFYEEDNSKVTVGGNVGTGNVADDSNQNAVTVDLFNGFGKNPETASIDGSNKSTNESGGAKVAYNDAAYNRRIALMKRTALSLHPNYNASNKIITPPPTVANVASVSRYPEEVRNRFKEKIEAPGGNSLNTQDVLAEELELYFKNRTRRVPYAEIPAADGTGATSAFPPNANGINTSVFTTTPIEPPAVWRELTNIGLTLTTSNLKQTQPEQQKKEGKETYLGDRVYVGNNLPGYWKNGESYVTGPTEKQFLGGGINWTTPNEPRYRTTQVAPIPDLGISERNGFWENAAAQPASDTSPNYGGLRVVTGAGIYVDGPNILSGASYPRDTNSFLLAPTLDSGVANPPTFSGNPNIVVWSDSMPMTGGFAELRKGDLQMRATAVYHYKDSASASTNYVNRTPTACISSYYDPTNTTTAKNSLNVWPANFDLNGRSNNGIVYPAPYTNDGQRVTAVNTNRDRLNRQAQLIFLDGRIVNQPLRDALAKIDASGTRSLADNSAIDTAICAIRILNGTLTPSAAPVLPHGAIREAAFLDARQVKAIDKTATNYDLELEQRQPLEIRVTDIDLDLLRGRTIGSATKQEYFIPNSGIIYATREDALLDESAGSKAVEPDTELLSPTDYRLDPTRRPNGIRLSNGSNLARQNTYREEEKGLILVTNLPAYVRGNFNLHQRPGTSTATEEFETTLSGDWGNFYDRDKPFNTNFACRQNQSNCGSQGDQWRPATIISDAITLLSNRFTDGFRDQGDYDLRNNAGSSVIKARKNNGFWDNSFITSAEYWNTSGTNGYPTARNSYLTNGVTPVQRRVSSPEYLMEVCTKIPVSTCGTSDWYVNPVTTLRASDVIGQPFNVITHTAGTTVVPAATNYQRFARRIAFKRRSNKTLELTQWPSPNESQATPIPLGINSSGIVAEYSYIGGSVPRLADNSLWYRTTTNTNGRPFCNGNNNPTASGCTSDNRTYRNDRPLYYDGSTKLTSPPTPEIPGVPSLNSPDNNPASGYTICTKNDGATNAYAVSSSTAFPQNCNTGTGANNPFNVAQATLDGLLALTPNASQNIVTPSRTGTTGKFPANAGTTTTFTSNPPASPQPGVVITNLIDLDGDFNVNAIDTRIVLKGDENSVFVFRNSKGSLDFGESSGCSTCRGVQLVLEGVNPNNVFWAADSNIKWNEVNSSHPHRLAGTFLNKGTGSPKWNNLILEGGRILDVNGKPSSSNFTPDPNGTKIYAIASTGQPDVVPVLQIHSPEGTPPTNNSFPTDGDIGGRWLQSVAANATMNAVFVSGNSPGRPAEESAGLHNFVRFIETWSDRTLNIRGSFIQFKRSAYATGPFATVLGSKVNANDGSMSTFGYSFTRYRTGNGTPEGTLPYYGAPTRQWGFDVALLSQPPDLFAERFTQQPTTSPDEYFREVSRDDEWVQTLLCAAQGSGSSYTRAVDNSEFTNDCPYPLSSYND